jgi:hypothetical protein
VTLQQSEVIKARNALTPYQNRSVAANNSATAHGESIATAHGEAAGPTRPADTAANASPANTMPPSSAHVLAGSLRKRRLTRASTVSGLSRSSSATSARSAWRSYPPERVREAVYLDDSDVVRAGPHALAGPSMPARGWRTIAAALAATVGRASGPRDASWTPDPPLSGRRPKRTLRRSSGIAASVAVAVDRCNAKREGSSL